MAARVVGDLNVRDARQQALKGGGQFAFKTLRVVDVVLQVEVVRAHLVHHRDGLVGAIQPKAGHVVVVDGLDQQFQARFAQGCCCVT